MKIISIEIKILEFSNIDELMEEEKKLLSIAREAAQKAYAPYSGFCVGAAVLLENGEIIKGNNQENAAYPSGLCAERTALFYAAANFPGIPIKALAISNAGNAAMVAGMAKPCGACRQVIAEYEDLHQSPIRIILDGPDAITIIEGIDNLLPLRFKKRDLEQDFFKTK